MAPSQDACVQPNPAMAAGGNTNCTAACRIAPSQSKLGSETIRQPAPAGFGVRSERSVADG
jgi:hypothetical protein